MTALLRIFARSTVILCGYIAGCVAAAVLLVLLLYMPHPGAMRLSDPSTLTRLVFLTLLIANAAFLPAIIAIAIAEVTGWRGWLYHALAGGAAAAFIVLMQAPADPDEQAALLIATGIIAGWVYWLIAGRSAGRWRVASPALRQQDPDGEG